jgi:hypothetical protein
VSYPIAPEDESTWFPDLQESLFLILRDQERRLNSTLAEESERFLRGGTQHEHAKVTTEQILSFRMEYLREAGLLKAERDHRKKVPRPSTTTPTSITLNISDSQVVGLNVAGVVNSLQANLATIQTGGEQGIAEALKQLAESIATDVELTKEVKADALSHVSAISDELARPEDERRSGVLRTVATGLLGLMGHASSAYGVYEILKTLLKLKGIELP